MALKKEKKTTESFQLLISILSEDAEYVPAYQELITQIKKSEYTLGSKQDVFKLTEVLMQLLPENAEIAANMAAVLWEAKKYKLAFQYALYSLTIYPTDTHPAEIVAKYYKQVGDTESLSVFCKNYPSYIRKYIMSCN